MERYKLSIRPGEENLVPKHMLEVDAWYFDRDSLARMYGGEAVSRFEKSIGQKLE